MGRGTYSDIPEIAAEEVQRRQVSRQAKGGTAPPTMTPAQTTWLSGTTPCSKSTSRYCCGIASATGHQSTALCS